MQIKYLSLEYVKETLIPVIHEHYVNEHNPAHDYLKDTEGMEQVRGCLERAQWDYVVGVIAKAVQQFLCINNGHHFENGNKRMSLVVLLSFIVENDYGFRYDRSKKEFSDFLGNLFPEYKKFEDEEDFNSIEFAYYNLTIIAADSSKYDVGFDELKNKIEQFLNFSLIIPEDMKKLGLLEE